MALKEGAYVLPTTIMSWRNQRLGYQLVGIYQVIDQVACQPLGVDSLAGRQIKWTASKSSQAHHQEKHFTADNPSQKIYADDLNFASRP